MSSGATIAQTAEARKQAAIAREAQRLFNIWKGQWCHHLIQADVDALVEDDRLWEFTRRPLNKEQRANCHENGWTKKPNGYRPTADEVNAWSLSGMGHDSINSWVCIRARCVREGIARDCTFCHGEGRIWPSDEVKRLHEEWEATEPPTGDGYQLWQTTSEGSPISPVFASLDDLCAWCATGATTFGDNHASAAAWRKMLGENFVRHEERAGNGASLIFL